MQQGMLQEFLEIMNFGFIHPSVLFRVRLKYFIPDLSVRSLADLDLDFLEKEKGIRAYILDFDDTLHRYNGRNGIKIDELVKEKFEEIRNRYPACIISNTNHSRREEIERAYGLYVVKTMIKKPRAEPLLEGAEHLGLVAQHTAIVGDRTFSDGLGAKLQGFYFIKVAPLSSLANK